MAATVWSGESGALSYDGSVYNAIRNWKVTLKADNQAVVDSATRGGTTRLGGNADWSGSFVADGYPVAHPGESVAFIGSIDNVKGVSGTIMVDSVRVNYDIATGAPVTHEVTFSGNGTLTLGEAVAADVSVADPVPSLGAKVYTAAPSATPTYTELPQVQTITLELKRANQAYSDSSTGGYTKRKRGPLDWTLSLKVSPNATSGDSDYGLEGLPQPKGVLGIKIEDANGDAYLLDWAMMDDISDIEVNRETQAIVSCTLNASMCGTTDVGGTQTLGSITAPDGSTIWPE